MVTKILLTVVVVALIWFGFKYAARIVEMREMREKREARERGRAVPGAGPSVRDEVQAAGVKDLVKCPVCTTFRAADAGSCGRRDCPY